MTLTALILKRRDVKLSEIPARYRKLTTESSQFALELCADTAIRAPTAYTNNSALIFLVLLTLIEGYISRLSRIEIETAGSSLPSPRLCFVRKILE
jgi:hypothetical protein